MNDVGRYMLGRAHDFSLPATPEAGIVVQPNFEIVFLAAAPAVEAELARFAERIGSGIGTLFRITRASILKAAAAGLTSGHVLDGMRALSQHALPANVEREIKGWFEASRHITGAPTYLIRCPDAETAARVVSVAGEGAQLLTADVVELTRPVKLEDLTRKLAKLGITAQLDSNSPSRKRGL